MKRGFTIIEFLVVLSLIGAMLALIIAATRPAQLEGRDSKRAQEIHQIDLAIRLYESAKGHAPDLQGRCMVEYATPPSKAVATDCFAVSTAQDGPQKAAWDALRADLEPYMSSLPTDPCDGSSLQCASPSTLPLGYSYVSPLAMHYFCSQEEGGCTLSIEDSNQQYQIYAPLENSDRPLGATRASSSVGKGAFFTPLATQPLVTLQAVFVSAGELGDTWDVTWSSTNATSCFGSDTQGSSWNPSGPSGTSQVFVSGSWTTSEDGHHTPVFTVKGESDTLTLICTGPGGTATAVRNIVNP